MTSKQRAKLRKLGNTMEAIIFIGVNGITDAVVKETYDALEKRELIKCSVQENSSLDAKEACNELCEKVYAEPIQVIGRKFILYKESRNHKTIDLDNL
ncbi:MAG: YhbY family RNA-binding protein [Christensenellaceae bacterium]|nr:YhbY family RNA-binding protein [Christensenellaceae bacterium]